MKTVWILFLSALGWALLFAAQWSGTSGPTTLHQFGASPLEMAALIVVPVLLGVYLALTLGKGPGPALSLAQVVLAIIYLALPYASLVPLLVQWGLPSLLSPVAATVRAPETRALAAVWLGIALIQAFRPPLRRRRAPLPAPAPDLLEEPTVLWPASVPAPDGTSYAQATVDRTQSEN